MERAGRLAKWVLTCMLLILFLSIILGNLTWLVSASLPDNYWTLSHVSVNKYIINQVTSRTTNSNYYTLQYTQGFCFSTIHLINICVLPMTVMTIPKTYEALFSMHEKSDGTMIHSQQPMHLTSSSSAHHWLCHCWHSFRYIVSKTFDLSNSKLENSACEIIPS